MILLLDNYDSFVHNLARYLRRGGDATRVIRSDAVDARALRALAPDAIVLSPGPKSPVEAGCSVDVVRELAGEIPILGVCLGHQAIAAARGGRIVAGPPVHGAASRMLHDGSGLFSSLPNPLSVGRYHSLCVEAESLPRDLQITATLADDPQGVMAIADPRRCLYGVQFHPESLLTQHGEGMIDRFLELAEMYRSRKSSHRAPVGPELLCGWVPAGEAVA